MQNSEFAAAAPVPAPSEPRPDAPAARETERRALLRACCALALCGALRARADETAAAPPPE
ncbi:MAG TPA: hypothetical protein VMU03_14305, partial [Gammaproteobacteria bacterium]|nr:hypothetical protein [Gammaproteobacteria bacterium]